MIDQPIVTDRAIRSARSGSSCNRQIRDPSGISSFLINLVITVARETPGRRYYVIREREREGER